MCIYCGKLFFPRKIYKGNNPRFCSKQCCCRGLFKTHGQAHKTAEWRVWTQMKIRCSRPNNPTYKYYGARGIKVCERWQRFENFFEDMGVRPSSKHEINRINNDGDYEPSNCEWATRLEQARNKTTSIRLTLGTQTLTLPEWAEKLGMKRTTLARRLSLGWSAEKTLTTPKR